MTDLDLLDAGTPREVLLRRAGGKASQLAVLESLGFAVPRWFCVPVEAMDGAIRASAGTVGDQGPPVPPAVADRVRRELRERSMDSVSVAVRSSGLEEDGAERSFAGQFESVLHCQGPEAVLAALRRCWASAFSERVRAYREALGDGGGSPRMGVIVQEMVEADAAGVAFSRHPLRPLDRDSVVIESVWGLAEGLVSGEMPADRFVVHRGTGEVQVEIARKEHARVRGGPLGGTRDEPLDAARGQQPSLTEEQARTVTRMAVTLEAALGTPQDCEWAFCGDRLLLLQSRPITTLPPQALFDPDVTGDAPVVWDNSNIIESYAGVTTPLTFSHVSRSYAEVYRVTCRVAGVPEAVIERNDALFRNMLGLIRGRIYYNLANWYRLLSLFPLLGRSGRFMETMMGVRQSLEGELAEAVDPTRDAPRYGVVRRLLLLVRLVGTMVAGGRARRAFLERMDDVCGPLETRDLTGGSLADQLEAHRVLEERVLKHWSAPIDNDTRCMISFGILGSLTRRWITADEQDAASLQNELLCGEGDLTSAEPTRLLMAIARDVASDAELRERFRDTSPEALWSELPDLAPALHARFRDYVRRYGFRCVDELKLESEDFHDRPHLLVATVQGYLRHGVPSAEELAARERGIREGAEARVRDRLGIGRRLAYDRVVRWTRRAVADRERLRFERTRAFGLIRRIFRGVGRNLAALGLLEDERDVFFLTVEEILAFAEGRSVSLDLPSLVEVRKREFEDYRRTPAPPDRFVTRGAVGASLRFPALLADQDLLAELDDPGDRPDLLRGTPCCAGVVEARVRVARSFEECAGLDGEILVTQRTDPGWIPVFPSLAGLIVERGGLLSHSAVVAREMGVPTIVGVAGRPLDRLRTGDRVRMDGARGTVEILP